MAFYIHGIGIRRISECFDVGIRKLTAEFIRQGITIRTQSEQETIKWSLMDAEKRTKQVEACHIASKGRVRGKPEKIKHANTKMLNASIDSIHEQNVVDFLTEKQYSFIPQFACDVYNIDIVINTTIAVEVFGGWWHRYGEHRAIAQKRFEKLIDSGYSIIILYLGKGHPFTSFIGDELVAFIDEVSRNKATVSKHRVIWGNSNTVTTFCRDSIDTAFITPTKNVIDPITGRYKSVPK